MGYKFFRRLNPVLSQTKTCQKQKKSLKIIRFQDFPLELLSRFELETSSLPIQEKLFFLVVGYCTLFTLIPCGTMDWLVFVLYLTVVCRVLIYPVFSCPCRFCVGFYSAPQHMTSSLMAGQRRSFAAPIGICESGSFGHHWPAGGIGTNSNLRTIPIPAASRFNVRKDGFPVPFSSLLMSA